MALYHYPKFPADGFVTLCGCGYRVEAREGSLIFTEDGGVWGHTTRIRLDREDHAWRLSIYGEPTPATAHASHVVQAVEFAKQWFGDGIYEPIKPLPVAR